VALKLNETHHLLAHADVNILGDDIRFIKKTQEVFN
jgi:hypothetical protein